MTIRPATFDASDLDAIVHQRRAMFEDMGYSDAAALSAMSELYRPWLLEKMQAREYLGWFALVPDSSPDSSLAAGLGLWLMDWPPHMLAPGPRRGNILNVYTEPAHRRRGLARALMEVALAWCAANRIGAVILHASGEGRPLYESLGFTESNEMKLLLPLP
jgi:GNAT superfamily N-acetyltransferase